MSFIKVYKQFVITAFNRKLLFLDGDSCWSYEIKPDLPLEKCRPRKYFDADSDSDEDDDDAKQKSSENQPEQQQSNGNQAEKVQIVALEVHETKSLLAVATSDKSLYLFEIDTNGAGGNLKFLSRRLVSRASSCMCFAASGGFLIVCDKGGDCYRYDCDDCKKPGRWLLGHMSQVLDVAVTDDEKLIITCDRDEKIRVTNHPECHTIETFCLGHGEFVSQLTFLMKGEKSYLLSLSGDKTLRFWDYMNGKELAKTELDQPGNRIVTKSVNDGSVIAAILCYEPTKIAIMKLNAENLKCDSIQTLNLKQDEVFSSFAFDEKFNLLTLVIAKSTEKVSLRVYQFDKENCKFSEQSSSSMIDAFTSNTESDCLPYVDSVSFLFKKKFDNIKDYQERKRRRMEVGCKLK
ncbi:tRNA (guanine-N(7)-)-methyltransferase non-catalytic subunit wuho [Ochlerotatus camptorhynchus]|uniref:tRNA (guanine-N(7)-)-methyltransferase non-catalytic subunit wuho n=1 Tax=Ochlerotatus camptorhynchus TaxID=644619 RepID=UPI0031E1C2B9